MKIYNTLTGKKEEFVPLNKGEVKIYSCGPTVYNYFHIGNARPFIIFDTLRRYFEYIGFKVSFIQNFTDIDDKMINKANEEGITVDELADRFINEYFIDAKGLNIKEATFHPRATENIPEIIATIETLVEKGFAYNVDGNVYFDVRKIPEYPKLSNQSIEDLESGARIEIDEQKKSPLDFALWKKMKENEPYWDSPWGKGRPGWHIECSTMAKKYLGETIDIHSGGQDLIFPHHENEIAQSECAFGKTFARYWMHNGYINVDNRKMSKSLNNFFTVRDVAEKYSYETIRFFMLNAHYKSPINFSEDLIIQSESAMQRIFNCTENLSFLLKNAKDGVVDDISEDDLLKYKTSFLAALDDDLNTADAIAAIFELVKFVNTNLTSNNSTKILTFAQNLIFELLDVLGIRFEAEEPNKGLTDSEIEDFIKQRSEFKSQKNFAEADKIRELLKEKGIILDDTKDGVKFKRV